MTCQEATTGIGPAEAVQNAGGTRRREVRRDPPEVQQYKDELKAQVEAKLATPDQFLDEFNDLVQDAVEIREDEASFGEYADKYTIENGQVQGSTIKIDLDVWTETTLNFLKSSPNKDNFITSLGLDRPAKAVITELTSRLEPTDWQVGAKGSSYVYEVLSNVLNNRVTNPLDALNPQQYQYLYHVNPLLHYKLTRVLEEAAYDSNIDKKKIEQFKSARSREARAIGNQQIESEFYDKFKGQEEDNVNARNFYESIKDGNVDRFVVFYRGLIDKFMNDGTNQQRVTKGEVSEAELLFEAEKHATEKLQITIQYMTNNIFASTLDSAPDKAFRETSQEQGTMWADPQRVFNETLFNKLSVIANKAQEKKGHDYGVSFYGFKRETREYIDEKTGTMKKTAVPVAELTAIDMNKWIESLRQVAKEERGALEFQFNLGYLIRHPGAADKGGVLGQMAEFAKTLDTTTLDTLYMLPYHEIIQAGVMGLEDEYEMLFSEYDWKNHPDIWEEVFLKNPPAEDTALRQLENHFGRNPDKHIPSWAIRRGFYHARLMTFGKELMFQLLTSYADPDLTFTGEPQYKGEGPLAANAAFNVWYEYMRWGTGSDTYIVGVGDMPGFHQPDEWHPVQFKNDVRNKLWSSSQENGLLAYYDHPAYRDHPPWFALHNFTKMGGVDAMGGWRLKYPYMQWLQGPEENNMVQSGDFSIDIQKKDPDMLVKGWKSLENIGVNVMKNYKESFLSDGRMFDRYKEGPKKGEFKYVDKYESLFKYLYDRYFKDGPGQAMYPDVQNADDFWKKIYSEAFENESMQMLDEHYYNAFTVLLFERQPLKFVNVEKKRSSQNGVTLRQELLDEFVVKGVKGEAGKHWKAENQDVAIKQKWKEAMSDIGYVGQSLRVKTTELMQERVRKATVKNEIGILYGEDLSKTRSQWENGHVYEVNEQTIETILRERYHDEPDVEDRIKRAKDVYLSIRAKIVEKPPEGKLEKLWNSPTKKDEYGNDTKNDAYDPAKATEVRENRLQNRISWFADNWQKGEFGRQFTSDTAGEFLNRSVTGEELVARTAGGAYVIAEAVKQYLNGGGSMPSLLDGLSDAVREGRANWDELYKGITAVYKSAKGEDKGVAKVIAAQLIHLAIQGMRRDDNANLLFGINQSLFTIAGERTSIAGAKVGDYHPEASWDKRDIFDFIEMFTEKNIIPEQTKKGERKFKKVPPTKMDKIMGFITGKEVTDKMVRDYESEWTGESLRHMHKATRMDMIKSYGIKAIGLVSAAILLILIKKALEDEEVL